MAAVYLARDLKHDRRVALKVLHPELAASLGSERFLREIKLTARLQHPHILPVFDSGESQGQLWYTMPYVEGESLRQRLRRQVQLGIPETIRIAGQVAAALDYAHEHGVIHRDIKPENILLEGDRALVADFGVARALDAAGGDRLTETGLALGTPAYMSPEQASAGQVDGRSDIYALGCVVYEMLAGEPPFTGPTAQAIITKRFIQPVPHLRVLRETVPESVDRAVELALAKVPADRFATAAEFVAALSATPPGPLSEPLEGVPLSRRAPARRRILLAVGAGVLVIGLAAVLRPSPPVRPTNPDLVAVLPFRVAGAAPELSWLREGLVDLLAIKLAGEGELRAAEPRAVLSAWHRLMPAGGDLPPETALQVADGLGAGRVIDGGVVGTAGHLTLTASMATVPGGRAGARASVEGPADSLPVLVDRLAAQLLGLGAGLEVHRLSSLTSSSRAAIQAYLAGRSAFRRGRVEEAARRFDEATRLDSTFALAAMDLARASAWGGNGEQAERGARLARAGRERLGPADRTLLDVTIAQWSSAPEMFAKWRAAVSAYPDRPEVWYGLGDVYYHWGALAGLDGSLAQAADAFRRGWEIDSTTATDSTSPESSPVFAEPLTHMVELAQANGDAAEVNRLVALGLSDDSTSDQGWYLRWHRATALGDSARRAFWTRPDISTGAFGRIHAFIEWTGVAPADLMLSLSEEQRRAGPGQPQLGWFGRYLSALNGGRPSEAPPPVDDPEQASESSLRELVLRALFWDGDPVAAAEAARRLAASAEAPARSEPALWEQYRDMCVVGQWLLAQKQTQGVDPIIGRLRTAHLPGIESDSGGLTRSNALCVAMLEAMEASLLRESVARPRVERLDSLARTFIFSVCCGQAVTGTNLVIARLAEMQGDLPRALGAVRRPGGGYQLAPTYLSTFLREEGRLATLTGDTAGAVRAYQHYLALRPNPEPRVRPEVERVRGELARLLGEQPKP
jgi:serine/threonine-protein kinase